MSEEMGGFKSYLMMVLVMAVLFGSCELLYQLTDDGESAPAQPDTGRLYDERLECEAYPGPYGC